MLTDSMGFKNNTLSRLPEVELNLIAGSLKHVMLETGECLCEAGSPIEKLFFVESGVVSAAIIDGENQIQVGMVGSDGFVGCNTIITPTALSYWQITVQIRGEAWMISRDAFHRCLDHAPTLRRCVEEQAQQFIGQVAQTSVCNQQHSITQRLARWLMIARDKGRSDDLPVSSGAIANSLGLTRLGLQVSLSKLEVMGLVRATRLRTLILDRYGLEEVACSCYARIRAFAEKIEAGGITPQRLHER